ncbi:MAG: AAA family ATPase [Candidatus Lokiarchaeota archaeon]|nr:AAA family ATPase [Candidatus Lokiarchaeota archaeon]
MNKNKNYISKIIFLIVIVLITIFFDSILDKIVFSDNNIFCFPIFSFLSPKFQAIFNVSVLLLLFFCFLHKHFLIRHHVIKFIKSFMIFGPLLQHYLFGLLLSLVISTLIFKSYCFQKMFLFNGDFIVYIFLLTIIFTLLKSKSPNHVVEFKGHPDTEKPITRPENDMLDFSSTVSDISAYILSQKNEYAATAIGVIGDWGSGKTSLLRLIMYNINLEKERNEIKDYNRLKVIYFNVSQFDDINLLFIHFYHSILEELEKEYYLPLIDKFNIFQSIVNTMGKGIKISAFKNLYLSNPKIENYLKILSIWLAKLNYTIVVLIDDMDRLLPKEMDGVFKLLRLVTSNMCNIVLVLTSEQKSLENYVNEFARIDSNE